MTLWPDPGPSPFGAAFDEVAGPVRLCVVVFEPDGGVTEFGSGTHRRYTAEEWAGIDGRGRREIPPLLNIPRPPTNGPFVKAYQGIDFDRV
jgi:hypothetical protein